MNGAGTDAKVFVTFNGDKKQIPKHQLQKPEGGKNPFEKDSKDVFKFNEADVGKVRLPSLSRIPWIDTFSMFSAENDRCGARWIELRGWMVSRLRRSEDQQRHLHVSFVLSSLSVKPCRTVL